MSWLHRLQQRLSITKNEALTLLSLSLFLLVGTAGRYACRQVRPVSAGYYAEFDSLFAERSAVALEPFDGSREELVQSGSDPVSHPPQTTAGGAATPLHVDLNRATKHELEQLPRVGPRTAERIIAFREAYGGFRSIDELLSVNGIGPKTLEQIRPHVHVTADSTR